MIALRIGCRVESHQRQGACWNCCSSCNYDQHRCGGCGEELTHDGRELSDPGKGLYHFDCLGEYTVVDGRIQGLTEFGTRFHPDGLDFGIGDL